MKRRYKIEVNHDGPIFLDTDIGEIETELGIDDLTIEEDEWRCFIYVWIDTKDYEG